MKTHHRPRLGLLAEYCKITRKIPQKEAIATTRVTQVLPVRERPVGSTLITRRT
jgi:hypothetical protein